MKPSSALSVVPRSGCSHSIHVQFESQTYLLTLLMFFETISASVPSCFVRQPQHRKMDMSAVVQLAAATTLPNYATEIKRNNNNLCTA